MAISIESIKNWFGVRGTEVNSYDDWDVKNIGNIIIPEKLSNKNAFNLANSVAEIYFPIDFCADRISKLRFFIEKGGREVKNTELNRFITNINPFYSFSDLVYQYVFSGYSDGNAINYLGVPSSLNGDPGPSNITRWDVLIPNKVCLYEKQGSLLTSKSLDDLIKKATYDEGTITGQPLELNQLRIHNFDLKRRSNSIVLSESFLWKANKSIDTLLSVYSARYNVYANNGAAGYLAKKNTTTSGGDEYAKYIMGGDDDNVRQKILNDINARNGLTGRRNLWGVSGVPIEFVKTLATINELMPLEETLENAIKIAGVFQIKSGLVPRKDQSTYANQASDEKAVWENSLLSLAQTVCTNLTGLFGLSKLGYSINFDASSVSALKTNDSENQDLIAKKMTNLDKLKQMNPDLDITLQIDEIAKSFINL